MKCFKPFDRFLLSTTRRDIMVENLELGEWRVTVAEEGAISNSSSVKEVTNINHHFANKYQPQEFFTYIASQKITVHFEENLVV